MIGFKTGVTTEYISVIILCIATELSDVEFTYITIMVPQNRDTTTKWNPQVEKAFAAQLKKDPEAQSEHQDI